MTAWSILHVNTEREWRGGEAQTLLLARGLEQRGHRCRVAAQASSPLTRKAREAELPVSALESRGEFDPRAVLRLGRLFQTMRPHLVHYHTSHAITLGALASLWTGPVRAVASRRVSFPLSRNPLSRFKYTRPVDRVIAVSDGIRSQLIASGVPPERVVVIPSAVDLNRFGSRGDREGSRRGLGIGPGEFVVGCVGHLAVHKGHAVLVEAARRLAAIEPGLRFILVGKGEEERNLRRKVEAFGLAERFRLIGFREDVAGLLPCLDLLAFPSLSGEGSPAVLKEAMACGIPLVASDIAGVREVVRPGVEGLLVPPGDPSALAEGILRLARDPELALEFARRGRERSKAFGADRMVERTESLYREVLEEPRP